MLRVLLCALVLTGCGASAAVTPTPTKTPVPTWTATVEPVVETPTPGVLVEAIVDAVFDDALRYVLARDPATVTAEQLTSALLSVVRRLAEGDRSQVTLDACAVVAGAAAARANETGAAMLDRLATACVEGDETDMMGVVETLQAAIGR